MPGACYGAFMKPLFFSFAILFSSVSFTNATLRFESKDHDLEMHITFLNNEDIAVTFAEGHTCFGRIAVRPDVGFAAIRFDSKQIEDSSDFCSERDMEISYNAGALAALRRGKPMLVKFMATQFYGINDATVELAHW
jgi:hypothetical protein